MIFNSEKVREYISSGAKKVATIRQKHYRLGQMVILKVGDKRMTGRVINIAPISSAEKFVKYSGFNDVKEWLEEAERLHGEVLMKGNTK